MSDHYVIVADKGHLRIFRQRQEPGQTRPALDEVDALDFPLGVKSYTETDTDMAGRFQGSKQNFRGPGAPTARTGMSIDERLPMAEEMDRRRIDDIAERIEAFLKNHADATWDFAAGPASHNAILEALSPRARSRLQRSVTKDLVNQPVPTLLERFGEG